MSERRGARFRWFPMTAVMLAIAGVAAVWNWPSPARDPGTRFFISFSIVGLTIILLFGWLIFFSGLHWLARLGVIAGIAAATAGTIWALEPQIEFDGQMNPSFTIRRRSERRHSLEAHRAAAPKADSAHVGTILETDYPEYRGNRRRDGVISGLQLDTDWKSNAPKEIWRQPCGGGYAGFVVAGDLAVTIEQRDAGETVVGYDAATGRERWAVSYPANFREPLGGDGPRATPTIAGDAVFAVGAAGMLLCLDADTGARRWDVDLLADNANIQWGQCGAPLVWDDLVIVTPGAQTAAAKGKAIRAYDRSSGKLVWATGDRKTAYSSPQRATIAGVEQIVFLDGAAVAGFDPHSGQELWNHPWVTYQDINVAQPLVFDDGRVFLSSGYGHGCTMLAVTKTGGDWSVRELWANTNLRCKFSSPVTHGGFIFGLDEAHLTCLDAATGQRKWKGNRYGYGQILLCRDLIIVGGEHGRLALVEAKPEEFREVAIIIALPGVKNWNHLAVANGRAYLRNHFEMACFELPQSR
jgi:outer membrane protein assembly factor BamB